MSAWLRLLADGSVGKMCLDPLQHGPSRRRERAGGDDAVELLNAVRGSSVSGGMAATLGTNGPAPAAS